ncbi:VOC family protein [Caulobacter sp. 17J65-9]|uniref:VOC family protein n=1 Tax=Caulobacter sp. 17J65-9 TaxID=2709382 RepID=UPI0013C8176F|nr:VOC family protein [Caulobacter sp. 17J65-9]NEX95035.1 VOC family protein [Caulobacter sp. 17J65-9]
MAKVLGLGGIFFKAADGDALSDWYRRVLGFEIQDGWGGAMWPHPQQGFTLWSPFKADTTYFEPSAQPFMINLIVDDLDGVLARAKDAGVEPLGREDGDANGQFAWLLDPAGVKVELWQPPAGA